MTSAQHIPLRTNMLAESSFIHSLAIGLVIAGVIILAWTFRETFGQALKQLFSKSARGDTSAAPDGRADLNAVMDDAGELAQLIADRLDRQAARLEELIAAADQRLSLLEQAAVNPQPAPAPAPRQEVADPLSRQVYDLSDRGLPSVEIARQLNQHTGKVELILALRQHA